MGDKKAMVAVDLMAYAKKVPVKKTKTGDLWRYSETLMEHIQKLDK